MSLASLVTCVCCGSLLGLLATPFSSLMALAGVGLGAAALSKIKRDSQNLKGKEAAIAGIAVGALSLIITILSVVLVVLGLFALPMARPY